MFTLITLILTIMALGLGVAFVGASGIAQAKNDRQVFWPLLGTGVAFHLFALFLVRSIL